MVSILGDYFYDFPKTIKLKKELEDLLEDRVNEKFYIKGKILQHIQKTLNIGINFDSFERYNGALEMWCRIWKHLSPTLNTKCKDVKIYDKNNKIRTMLPKECFRIMGVKDQDFQKIAKNQSNASLYHLAGDSIVVNVLMAIFRQMI